ncbi:unnamed protein product [Phytophthora fragariaefolia]|uniref:Unnamed protein product n=1 Tax=Phytophthora fragariaefolia TaxID=1490495 RepID=A0A9W6UAA0_9STRA|nr:unnamed protein product [Phytophthora fragariaefolia]
MPSGLGSMVTKTLTQSTVPGRFEDRGVRSPALTFIMVLKTGMLVGIVGTEDIGVLIQIRPSSNSCVIKLNNGTLKKNVPLEDVEEAKDMSDTKEKKSPIRLGGVGDSPGKSPAKLASLSVDTKRSSGKLKTVALEVGDAVKARSNGGSRWLPGKISKVHRDGTYDVEYADGEIEKKMAADDVEAASKLDKTPLGASSPRKKPSSSGFEVGDKVKARYKKGAKYFSGEISRVRSDGTYDIKYEDGDSETRVEKEMIEPTSEIRKRDSDDEGLASTRKKTSSGFRVDQSVKARYKGGKKFFSGKIKRAHSDGTYDVLYDDGDEEKRVKPENIEAIADPKVDSEEERKSMKETSTRSKLLAVGKKVKAHYKKGKRLYHGKISRVRPDGTYDIDYDDGEMETRVEASQIEVDGDEDDMFADSDEDKNRESTTKKETRWEVGDRVKAYYGRGTRLFPGKIAKVHVNGTYDIKYDDGDLEARVDGSLIEPFETKSNDKDKPTRAEDVPEKNSKNSTKRSLRVGDSVKAKYKRGARFFSGKITRERMDGTFDIKYEDGDVEERVEVDFIQRIDDGEDRSESRDQSKKSKNQSFEVGDIVKAPFQQGVKLFRGKISRIRSDETYDIVFDDGDRDSHVPGDLIQREEGKSNSEQKPKTVTLKAGDVVNARYKKGSKRFAGTITRARSDGTYDIRYDDGDVEMRVEMDMIEVLDDSKRKEDPRTGSPKLKTSMQVGDKVRAHYNKGSKMFSGEITAVHRDGTYDIRYDDGDKEKDVDAKDIEIVTEQQDTLSMKKGLSVLKVGDFVETNYKNGVKMLPGKISRVHSDGSYDVTFDDGDTERRVPKSRIKLKADGDDSPKQKSVFKLGDAVKAKYKKGSKFFSGKIARVRLDGTYDIEYDDGDFETRVDGSLILGTERVISKTCEDSPKSSRRAMRFEVGDVVKARYKKGAKFFSGKITRVRLDGTYDIRYDDGDTEMYVEGSLIESEEKANSQEADGKPTALTVGDKVNAKYKGGLKAFPGKIVKPRLDGTFDIEYDDGDMEQRVKRSAIELILGAKNPDAKPSLEKDDIFGDSDSDGKSKMRDDKKSRTLKIGDVIEANFKLKGKFHRGKVTRVRSDGTYDIEYDVGATEKHVHLENIKNINDNQERSDDSGGEKKTAKKKMRGQISGSDRESPQPKKHSVKKSRPRSSSESSGTDLEKSPPLKKGSRVTYRKANDNKCRRVGVVRKVHSDGSCDIKYDEGDTSKRIARKLLVPCSDSDDSDDAVSMKLHRTEEGLSFRRNERVLSNWRRSSKISKPRKTNKWSKATVLEKNGDGTYTVGNISLVCIEMLYASEPIHFCVL